MSEQAALSLREVEARIGCQISKIKELERAGRWPDAVLARELLAVITETRDAMRLHQKVAEKVMATQARWVALRRILTPPAPLSAPLLC